MDIKPSQVGKSGTEFAAYSGDLGKSWREMSYLCLVLMGDLLRWQLGNGSDLCRRKAGSSGEGQWGPGVGWLLYLLGWPSQAHAG